jgi:hypothetical protein
MKPKYPKKINNNDIQMWYLFFFLWGRDVYDPIFFFFTNFFYANDTLDGQKKIICKLDFK